MNKERQHVVLTIAGSDSSGRAGIQADIATIRSTGCHAATVITAVTAQNRTGVQAIHTIPTEIVEAQIRSVIKDTTPSSIKIGMIYNAEITKCIVRTIRDYPTIPIIYDPVMVSTSGGLLMSREAVDVIKEELFPICELITPNIPEASTLTNREIKNTDDMSKAAKDLSRDYNCNVLLKGGHLQDDVLTDILCLKGTDEIISFNSQRIREGNFSGTGCRLSSGIAGYLAMGLSLTESIKRSKTLLEKEIIESYR